MAAELSLRELQRWMRWALTDPRGVASALQGPPPAGTAVFARYEEPSPRALHLIEEREPLSAIARIDIYAEAYFARILESLGADFPTLLRAVGEDDFARIASEYLKRHPSRSPNINDIGRHLPAFLQSCSKASEPTALSDIALLEWKTAESFYAETLPPFDAAKFASVAPDQWFSATFVLDPSIRLLQLAWPVHRLWLARSTDDFDGLLENLAPETSHVLVHRHGVVQVKALEAEASNVLGLLQSGNTLQAACELLSDDSATERIATLFATWVRDGLIRDVHLS